MTSPDKSPLEEQAYEALSILQNLMILLSPDSLSRDEMRAMRMAIQRLERGLAGQRGTDMARTLLDWTYPES